MKTPKTKFPKPLKDYFERLMNERSIPGLQFAIVNEGQLACSGSLGIANLEHGSLVNQNSIFSINSMAKAFTGIAVMQLEEEGLLNLSAPISTYLEDLPDQWKDISALQLATLTAGVPEIMEYTDDNNVTLIGDGSEEQAWQYARTAPMEYPPGEGYAYNQTSYAILGKIVENLSNQPFTEFVATRQFRVANMSNTHYVNDQEILKNRANTYMSITVDGDPTGKLSNSYLNWPPALLMAAGLQSTAEDLASWIIALQRGDLLVHSTSIEKMFTAPRLFDGRNGVWGIGWHLGLSKQGRVPAPGGGAKAQVVVYPTGLAIVLLTNLLGAFPEHLAPVQGESIDLGFIDPIAENFEQWNLDKEGV